MILLAFVLWLLAEIAAAIAVAHLIGVGLCILALIAGWPVGALLMRAEGRAVLRRLREALAGGHPSGADAGAAALGLLAGPLFIIPGFVTDLFGLLLLVPALRRRAVALIAHRARRGMFPGANRGGARRAYDVDGHAHETAPTDPVTGRGQLHG